MNERFALPWILAALLLGCSDRDGNETTAGKRIVLHTTARGEDAAKAPFTTGFGWDVSLSRAAVAVSGLYYFDGPPPTAHRRGSPRLPGRWLERAVGIGTAWAHPGHYQSGTALGQALFATPVVLDAFAGSPLMLADGEGITGTYRSARLVLATSAPADAVLSGHIAIAEGRATKHGEAGATPIYFRLFADAADLSASVTNGAVDGCVLDETTVNDDGTMAIEVKPTVWLNLVDFSNIAPGTEVVPTEVKERGFAQGVTQLSAYHVTYTK